jgi:HEPN domain-containing protein
MDNNLREGMRWLDQAEADLKTSRDCLNAENYYASAFFSQQAAEKALKGFLYTPTFIHQALPTNITQRRLRKDA